MYLKDEKEGFRFWKTKNQRPVPITQYMTLNEAIKYALEHLEDGGLNTLTFLTGVDAVNIRILANRPDRQAVVDAIADVYNKRTNGWTNARKKSK